MLPNQSITSIESVFDLAVGLEKHGQSFYENARDAVNEAELKETFAALAAEEKRQIKPLIKRRKSLRKDNGVA